MGTSMVKTTRGKGGLLDLKIDLRMEKSELFKQIIKEFWIQSTATLRDQTKIGFYSKVEVRTSHKKDLYFKTQL